MSQATSPTPHGRRPEPGGAGPHDDSWLKGRQGLARVLHASRYSWQGLKAAWKHEAAFRQEVLIGVPFIAIAAFTAPGRLEALALIGVIVLAWVTELLNSGIEAVADAVSLNQHPLLGRAKDFGSAAVMLTVAFAAIVWAVIYWPVFFR
jgi:diacylglycerol kinase (ATP)